MRLIAILFSVLMVLSVVSGTAVAGDSTQIEWEDDNESEFEFEYESDDNITFTEHRNQIVLEEFEFEIETEEEDGLTNVDMESEFEIIAFGTTDHSEFEVDQFAESTDSGIDITTEIEMGTYTSEDVSNIGDGGETEFITFHDSLAVTNLGVNESNQVRNEFRVIFLDSDENEEFNHTLAEIQDSEFGTVDTSGVSNGEIVIESNYTYNEDFVYDTGYLWKPLLLDSQNSTVESLEYTTESEVDEDEYEFSIEADFTFSEFNREYSDNNGFSQRGDRFTLNKVGNLAEISDKLNGVKVENGTFVFENNVSNVSMKVHNGSVEFDGETQVDINNRTQGELLNVTVERDDGMVTFRATGGNPNEAYNIYEDGEVIDTVLADENGTIEYVKDSNWSPHTVVISESTGGSLSGTTNVLLIVFAIVAIVLGIFIFYREREMGEEYIG